MEHWGYDVEWTSMYKYIYTKKGMRTMISAPGAWFWQGLGGYDTEDKNCTLKLNKWMKKMDTSWSGEHALTARANCAKSWDSFSAASCWWPSRSFAWDTPDSTCASGEHSFDWSSCGNGDMCSVVADLNKLRVSCHSIWSLTYRE